jgi:hypothetical protein
VVDARVKESQRPNPTALIARLRMTNQESQNRRARSARPTPDHGHVSGLTIAADVSWRSAVSSALRSGRPHFGCRWATIGLLASVLGLAGCSHYQLGTGAIPSFRTIYVEPVSNKTLLPQSQPLLSTYLRESFLRDQRVTLVNSPDAADATLAVVINDYRREVAAVREDDTGLARKFNVTLGVACTLRDRRSGRPIFEGRLVSAQREVFTDSGQLQAEYQTLPLLAESLSGKIVHTVLDVW